MTGPEHFRAAEEELRLIEINRDNPASVTRHGIAATVHAALANAAATALEASRRDGFGWSNCADDIDKWQEVAGSG